MTFDPKSLCEFELEVLSSFAGQSPAKPWGAAVGQAIEVLRGSRLVDDAGNVTERGLEVLKEFKS